jgi:predicted dehydrogenase
VEGTKGELETTNLVVPHFGHEWKLRIDGGETTETFDMAPTFVYQWREIEIVDVVRNGAPIRTPISDGIANMRVIDAIDRAAGMRTR